MNELKNVSLKTQDIIGKPIISLEGEELGTIGQVAVDYQTKSVAGFLVNIKGWFKGEKGLEFNAIKYFGDYAVTVESSGQVIPLDDLPAIQKLAQNNSIYGMRIVTPEGKLIGTVDDFYFNQETGEIEAYVLSGGIIKSIVKGRARVPANTIQTIGKDAIIASPDVEKDIIKDEGGLQERVEQLKDDIGNWKDDLTNWKDDFEKLWEKTRDKTLNLSKSMGENIKEAARAGKDKSSDLLSKTGEILTEQKAKLQKSYEEWRNRIQAIKTKPETPLSEQDSQALVGRIAGKTVKDDNDNIIIEENTQVNPSTIEEAQKAGKVKELVISVATKDLEEQIKTIEDTEKKEQ